MNTELLESKVRKLQESIKHRQFMLISPKKDAKSKEIYKLLSYEIFYLQDKLSQHLTAFNILKEEETTHGPKEKRNA